MIFAIACRRRRRLLFKSPRPLEEASLMGEISTMLSTLSANALSLYAISRSRNKFIQRLFASSPCRARFRCRQPRDGASPSPRQLLSGQSLSYVGRHKMLASATEVSLPSLHITTRGTRRLRRREFPKRRRLISPSRAAIPRFALPLHGLDRRPICYKRRF